MNLQNLRVFLKVAELEHITHASVELNLSQPAVTKTIQSLEHEVGLELIERQGRRIVLTHAGRVLQSYARQIFALEREMEEALAALRDIEAGEVTLAANTTAGVYLLPPIVARFRARYPQVTLNISIMNSQEIVEETLNWNLDFGLVEREASHLPPGLKVTVFAYDELILVVAPEHRWNGVLSLRPEALGKEELILREQGSGIREVIEQALLAHNVIVHPLLTLTDNEAIKQMVMSGVGAAIVSSLSVQRELANGDLVQVPIEGLELHPQLSLIQRADKQLSRAAQAFCSFLRPALDREVDVED
ncbi:MAG TPA: LysR family transcriptional regulator [Ktedonobacteraceae bacterium]|jgi:DNA-binding transcriptional LysR family regulator|nr:LysR family transcriptional regulator [Ktedonobacteraceae bacterium]